VVKGKTRARKNPDNSAEYFGYPWPKWFRMRDAAIALLKDCARSRETTCYGALWQGVEEALGEDIGKRGQYKDRAFAGAIGWHSNDFDKPMLTSLIVREKEGHPGRGFFMLAVDQGRLSENDGPKADEDWSMTPLQRHFWETPRNAVFDQYASGIEK